MGLKVKGFLDDVDSTKPCKTVIKFFYDVVFKIQMGYLCQTFLKYNKGMTSKKKSMFTTTRDLCKKTYRLEISYAINNNTEGKNKLSQKKIFWPNFKLLEPKILWIF